MALGEGLKFHYDDNYFGTNSDARIISLLDDNDVICDGGLIIDERATSNGVEHVTELLRIRDSEFKWKGNDILHTRNSSVSGNTININGTSTTWTDTKVTQTISTSNNTDYRPVILGNSSNGSTNSFSTTTSSVLAAVNVYIKPDNGNLYTKGSLNASTTVSAGSSVTAATSVTSTAGDFYVGGTSGSRCHIKMDTTNKCIKFIFD